jgi:hypothetical protein
LQELTLDRPKQLSAAIVLMWVAYGLAVMSGALSIWKQYQSGSLAGQSPVALAVILIIALALLASLIVLVRAGRGWARALYVALMVVSLFAVLQDLSEHFGRSTAEGLAAIAYYLAAYGAAVLLITPPVHRWFTRKQ